MPIACPARLSVTRNQKVWRNLDCDEKSVLRWRYENNFWTSYEEAVLRTYYREVPMEALVKFYNRTENAI